MALQTIFQAGNSRVVAIPKDIVRKLKLKIGQQVIVDTLPDTDTIVIKTKKQKSIKRAAAQKEFQRWLDQFIQEDGALLDELANR